MAVLPLIIAPDPIFRAKAESVSVVNDEIRGLLDDLYETMLAEHGIGIAGNMVGVLKRLVVINLNGSKKEDTLYMVNPEITILSDEKQTVEEASLCFLGIAAKVTRPKNIRVSYLDYQGNPQIQEAEGLLSSCIQHEVDYLNGITFLDHLPRVKKDVLTRKMTKAKKRGYVPHVHSAACQH